jgi:hypothetical protein
MLKNSDCRLVKKTQRRDARKIDKRTLTCSVRWSKARNEAYEVFSAVRAPTPGTVCVAVAANNRPPRHPSSPQPKTTKELLSLESFLDQRKFSRVI